MSKVDVGHTFETSPLFEKYGQAVGNVVAGSLFALGLANCVDEILDVREAENSVTCANVDSPSCQDLLSREQNDALKSSLGGLGLATMLGGLTIIISRRENLAK